MKEESTVTSVNGSNSIEAGATPNEDTAPSPTESTMPAEGPSPIAGVDGPSTRLEEGACQALSNITARETSSIDPETTDSPKSAEAQVVRISGIKEIYRNGKTATVTTWKPPFQIEKGLEASFAEIYGRAKSLHNPLHAIPLPTGAAPFGSAIELFGRLQAAIAEQASVPAPASTLLSFWALSTWFSDALEFAPGLVVAGRAHEADLVLRALRNYCRYPLMLTRADVSSLQKVSWDSTPTLLFWDPNVSKQMASIMSCSTSRGYMIDCANGYRDFFAPKAIFLGEEASTSRTPRRYLQVNVNPLSARALRAGGQDSQSTVQILQNQLLMYRLKNLVKVYNSDFDAAELTSETRAIANALCSCIVDSPKLQSELVTLLTPIEDQHRMDRATSLEAFSLEATLNLAHAGKAQVFIGEIAGEINRMIEARGERLRFSAEKIGHAMKKVGLVTRRISNKGNGLVLDLATLTQIRQLAGEYGGVGLDQDESTYTAPHIPENKSVT